MMLQKLKRTLAVTCLLATACFVILWMRSLKQHDHLQLYKRQVGWCVAHSFAGGLQLSLTCWRDQYVADPFIYESSDRPDVSWSQSLRLLPSTAQYQLPDYVIQNEVILPYWLLAAASGAAAITLFIKRPIRFSLRTLAIAATLIVVTLGMGVAASRLTLG